MERQRSRAMLEEAYWTFIPGCAGCQIQELVARAPCSVPGDPSPVI